ncbi:MAG: terminase [Clostridia bacterium]|jgi:hypothetical protein|nr:terminase [Clostridia bacterium]
MGQLNGNQVISGTFGRIWVNNELWAECKSFEAKVSGDFEDVTFCGDLATHNKYMGWTGEGTIVCHKIDSKLTKMLQAAFKTGKMPSIKIVAKLDDPASYGAERIEILNVQFTEFMLMKFASKELQEVEAPFKFSDYNPIDLI